MTCVTLRRLLHETAALLFSEVVGITLIPVHLLSFSYLSLPLSSTPPPLSLSFLQSRDELDATNLRIRDGERNVTELYKV